MHGGKLMSIFCPGTFLKWANLLIHHICSLLECSTRCSSKPCPLVTLQNSPMDGVLRPSDQTNQVEQLSAELMRVKQAVVSSLLCSSEVSFQFVRYTKLKEVSIQLCDHFGGSSLWCCWIVLCYPEKCFWHLFHHVYINMGTRNDFELKMAN